MAGPILRRRSSRKREKPPWERFKDHCRSFTAFMFSNVGIILLVIFYTIGGAFIFQAIEIYEFEQIKLSKPEKFLEQNFTRDCMESIWHLTARNISFFHNTAYKSRVNDILLEYQRKIVKRQLDDADMEKQWSFSGAFLYSLTVITTIGYGNISPKSDYGKLVTILYAIIGMPLFLLYLSNIGDVLAKSFKWIYSKVCLCRICPGVARRRIIRERRKIRRLALKIEAERLRKENCNSSLSSRSSSTMESSSSISESSYSTLTDEIELGEEENDSDIEREISASTDEITVPLTVCVFIMISYILAGAILFSRWEDWDYLDGSYFCFISLSSIGFGDLVPGDRVITADKDKVEMSFILCAVYLLLGMALIAMCFNLMQEQVIHNMRAVKRAFKACFRCGAC